ncbi:Mediator of RNA polymerase II transcription subunit 28 [Trichoplax sp. H2]|uniref:Mediator of RNA polymerase II transcription subunit 28 n=1 Tax=Trichoplax adhaerens TaxID=10228 RepID=B3SB57_TRIAD|nr:predicted protein [Trichoplax adhaerens]EDV20050.1 predicted protein [Trichoplax adhaerens]RDD45556.1 Mediator of RNA polymerase II transcription subunit 28 [Trichoplax sp. H2]|eukprot:XP_002117434.1 predicted protein [Trichoplax adhaerens]
MSENLIDQLEDNLKDCVNCIGKKLGEEDLKVVTDKFIECSQRVEDYFLKYGITQNKVKNITYGDVAQLKDELERKELLLKRNLDKLTEYQSTLDQLHQQDLTKWKE